MAAKWYYQRGQDRHGPVEAHDLIDLAKSGRLSRDDLVWKEDGFSWRLAYGCK